MRPEELNHRLASLLDQAASLYTNKRYAEAAGSYDEAVALLRRIGSKGDLVKCLMDRATCRYVIRRQEEAVRDYDEALPYLKKHGEPGQLIACVMNRALCYSELGFTKKALKEFEEGIVLFRRHKVYDGFARGVMYRAHCWYTLGQRDQAIAGYDEAAPLLRAASQFSGLAHSLHNRANCTYELGRKAEALAGWNEAMPLFREYGPRIFMEECLTNRATCLSQEGYFDEAIADIDEVLPLLRERESSTDIAKCMMIRALCLDRIGSEADAVAAYNEILAHYRAYGPRDELARCLMVHASYLRRCGRHTEALSGFEEVLGDVRAVLDRDDVAQCLMQQGNCLIQLGRGAEALSCQDQAFQIFRQIGSNGDLADCLGNRAICLHFTGQEEQALEEFDKAIQRYRDGGSLAGLAQCLMNRASCLNSLGRWKDALVAHDEALALLRQHGELRNVAGCLLNRSTCVRQIGQAEDVVGAIVDLEEALEIFGEHGTPTDVAQCLGSRASCFGLLGQSEEALAGYRAALLLLREHGRSDDLAGCLMNEGISLEILSQYEDALENYNAARAIFDRYGSAADSARCMMQQASCLASLKRYDDGLAGFDEAFAVEDRASTRLQDPKHRILAREQTTHHYRVATRIALDQEQPDRAWGYVQRGKGRTLIDLLSARAERTALDRREALLIQQREAGLIEHADFTDGRHHVQMQRLAQRAARLGEVPWIPLPLTDVVAVLRPGEVLLDVFADDSNGSLMLFLLRPGQASVSWVGHVAGNALQALVDRWQAARATWVAWAERATSQDPVIVARRNAEMARADDAEHQVLEELGALIFVPVLEQVDELVTTLIVSPDGLLHRLPLAAVTLLDNEGQPAPLIERLDLQLVPSATSLAILRRSHGPRITWPAALLAAAPFAIDDSNDWTRTSGIVSEVSRGFRNRLHSRWPRTPDRETRSREAAAQSLDSSVPPESGVRGLVRAGEDPGSMDLPHSGSEIAAVAYLLRTAGGTASVLSRQKATRSKLEAKLPVSRILHLATHGGRLEKNETVMDYRIFLANDTDVRIHELYDGIVSLKDIFLVTLSACSLGEVALQGAEASGFVQGFLQAGAAVVLAPLWDVDDRATMLLMVRFYEELIASDRPAIATAWRRACQWLRTKTEYTHPIYWAGFLPSGDASLRLIA